MDNEVQKLDSRDDFSKKYSDDPTIRFSDISDESWRTYHFPNGHEVTVYEPVALRLKLSSARPDIGAPHSHYVVDLGGVTHYIAPGFLSITWKNKSGKAVRF